MGSARVNGIDIWYDRSGSPGPLLVLTHGFAGPTGGWPSIIDDFKARFDLLLYDMRAHGKTTVPDDPATVTMPQLAADLAGLLDVLGIERAHIGGVSMGGMVTAQFACDYPERLRSVLLCDTTAGNCGGPSAAANKVERKAVAGFERMAHIVEKYGVAELADREDQVREADPYARLSDMSMEEQAAKNRRQKVGMMSQAGVLAANLALRERPDLTSRTPAITAPTLVSCGEWDDFYPCAQRDHALISNSRFVTVRKAAHSTPDFRPQLWRRAVFDFIHDVEAGRDVRGEFELS